MCSDSFPSKLLVPILHIALVKSERNIKSSTSPPKRLPPMPKNKSLFNFLSEGTFPVRLFPFSRSIPRFEELEIEVGIDPVNWLVPIEKYWRCGRERPKLTGRVPCN